MVPLNITQKSLKISLPTIKRISDLLSRWIVTYQLLDETFRGKLGGKNKIVEIDESCFFKRKFNKGRLLNQIWGFGIVERESGRLLVQVVEKRNASTLLPIIQKWISTDCLLVVSDEWKAYGKLKNLNYNHEKVNHSKNFADVNNSRIHTQTMRIVGGKLKAL